MMPTESAFLLAGLLFVAAALGYFFARFGESEDDQASTDRLNADYLKGINYVLNEEPDRAVELFTRMAELDDEALETHFALGSLFRKRGEVDRAIRVHQNLMARPSLSQMQKIQAEAALAEDYLSAGLFDRAESLFQKLSESPDFRVQALKRLIRIYEVTREWTQAIETTAELEAADSMSAVSIGRPSMVAHYYCELAEEARAAKDYATARELLGQAESGRHRTVRSVLARADLARDSGKEEDAIRLYRKVVRASPELLVEVIPRLAACYLAVERAPEFTEYLRKLINGDEDNAAAIAMATVLDTQIDDPVAMEALHRFVAADAKLAGLVDVKHLESADDSERLEILDRIRRALKNVVSGTPGYRCDQCGYASLVLQWQCSGCRSWETVKPANRINLVSTV
jgi:lipopolysaccharide biosynthesis regulator YciM